MILSALVLLASCGGAGQEPELVSGEIMFTPTPGKWIYISLEDGCIVGSAKLGDEAADEMWAGRDDWDIAVCDSLIRTNGGTSGHGLGLAGSPDYYQDIW